MHSAFNIDDLCAEERNCFQMKDEVYFVTQKLKHRMKAIENVAEIISLFQ